VRFISAVFDFIQAFVSHNYAPFENFSVFTGPKGLCGVHFFWA